MQILDTINAAARAVEGAASVGRHPFTSAVILAGGCGTRMGGTETVTKQFMELDGMPVILHTVLAFQKCEAVDEIVLVVREEERENYPSMLREAGVTKVKKIVPGGKTRQESAKAGMNAVNDKCRFLAIHDGARPLILPDEITTVAKEAYRIGAAAAASHAKDTVKITDGNRYVKETADSGQITRGSSTRACCPRRGSGRYKRESA